MVEFVAGITLGTAAVKTTSDALSLLTAGSTNPTNIITFQNSSIDIEFQPTNSHWNSFGRLLEQPAIKPNETVHITATGCGYVEYQAGSIVAAPRIDESRDRSKLRRGNRIKPFRLIIAYGNPILGVNKINVRMTRDMAENAKNVYESMDDCYKKSRTDSLDSFAVKAINFADEPHNAVIIFSCTETHETAIMQDVCDSVDAMCQQADSDFQDLCGEKAMSVVREYLRLGKANNVDGLLELFDEKADITIDTSSSAWRVLYGSCTYRGKDQIRGYIESQMPYEEGTTDKEMISEATWSGNLAILKVNFDMWKMLKWHSMEARFVLEGHKIQHLTLSPA